MPSRAQETRLVPVRNLVNSTNILFTVCLRYYSRHTVPLLLLLLLLLLLPLLPLLLSSTSCSRIRSVSVKVAECPSSLSSFSIIFSHRNIYNTSVNDAYFRLSLSTGFRPGKEHLPKCLGIFVQASSVTEISLKRKRRARLENSHLSRARSLPTCLRCWMLDVFARVIRVNHSFPVSV